MTEEGVEGVEGGRRAAQKALHRRPKPAAADVGEEEEEGERERDEIHRLKAQVRELEREIEERERRRLLGHIAAVEEEEEEEEERCGGVARWARCVFRSMYGKFMGDGAGSDATTRGRCGDKTLSRRPLPTTGWGTRHRGGYGDGGGGGDGARRGSPRPAWKRPVRLPPSKSSSESCKCRPGDGSGHHARPTFAVVHLLSHLVHVGFFVAIAGFLVWKVCKLGAAWRTAWRERREQRRGRGGGQRRACWFLRCLGRGPGGSGPDHDGDEEEAKGALVADDDGDGRDRFEGAPEVEAEGPQLLPCGGGGAAELHGDDEKFEYSKYAAVPSPAQQPRPPQKQQQPDSDSQGDDYDYSDYDGEHMSMARELASFRTVADMVGDMVAVEEGRARARAAAAEQARARVAMAAGEVFPPRPRCQTPTTPPPEYESEEEDAAARYVVNGFRYTPGMY